MRDLKKRERSAIDAVARQFSATSEQGSGSSDACLVVAGKRIAVDIASLEPQHARQGQAAGPRLRFDKVATRLVEGLQTTLGETVPDTVTVVVTITAPIRLAAKTAAALEDKIHTLLGRRLSSREEKGTIHGNRVRIRLLKNASQRAPKLIGFVHNADSDPRWLLNRTSELLELISTEAGRRAPRSTSDRWLIVMSDGGVSTLAADRYICSQLRLATAFKKILMVFDDGRVGILTG